MALAAHKVALSSAAWCGIATLLFNGEHDMNYDPTKDFVRYYLADANNLVIQGEYERARYQLITASRLASGRQWYAIMKALKALKVLRAQKYLKPV